MKQNRERKQTKENQTTEMMDKEKQCKIKSTEAQENKSSLKFINYRAMAIYC